MVQHLKPEALSSIAGTKREKKKQKRKKNVLISNIEETGIFSLLKFASFIKLYLCKLKHLFTDTFCAKFLQGTVHGIEYM